MGDAQIPGEVPSLGHTMDHRDDGETQVRRRVVVPLGSEGNGSHGDPPHRSVHQEAEVDHSGKGGPPLHL